MLLMLEKGISGGICHTIHRYGKANSKYIRDYYKNKESPYLKYWDVINLYGWPMSQKLNGNNFKWVENISEFDESLKNYNEESDQGYFLKLMFSILKTYINFTMIYLFCLKEWKLKKKLESL